jgi:peptidyl-prolyl cis-trans isomerase SurA
MRGPVCILALPVLLSSAVILDRIAVIAGTHAIKLSDIDRDVRLTQFINEEPLNLSAANKHAAAERLITQDIIRQAIITGGYRRPPDSDGAALVTQLRRDRFSNSDQRMREALRHYGLTEAELQERLLWQTTVLQFIDQRFRAGVIVADEDIRKYYAEHAAALRKEYPNDRTLEELTPKIKATIQAERINENFDQWLDQTRQGYRVEYKPEAFDKP